jgi:hypothetical protein
MEKNKIRQSAEGHDLHNGVDEMKKSVTQNENLAKMAKVATGFGIAIILAIAMSI